MDPNNSIRPTGTVTFLFTDIEGSTALYENHPYQMEGARKRHDEILREAIEAHGGYVFKTVGDAFCAAFSTAREAMQSALAAQRALFAERWPENVTIRARIGLHTGAAEESEGDYFGPPVNRVARLMSTGHGGQILLSDPTYNLVRDALVHMEPEAEASYLGEHRLKDLRHTERIFQLIVPDLPKEFPPLRTHGIVTPEEVVNLEHRYRRIRFLGGGGFGNVYLVHHETLDRDMALKVLGQQYTQDEQFKERFKREARSAAKLNHPNIVQVYDAGEGLFEGQKSSYITMEYVPGGTLEDLIAEQGGPLPARMATELTIEVAKALEAAHKGGVIHRDIKPQNVLLTESGGAKVADFGIARAAASSTKLTRTGFLMGTLHYMSPEQAHGKPASPRSDLYSLGVVLYQMLTGELPFDAETPAMVMVKHISEAVRPPKEVNPDVPDGLNEVCIRLLAKDPEERYPDAGALIRDLERVKEDPQALVKSDMEPTVADIMGPTVLDDDLEEARDDTGIPTMVEVPDLVGQKLPQARGRLAETGLSVGSQSEAPSETVPEDEIIEQEPPPGTEVEAGSSVRVTVSSGSSTVEVPDIAGLKRSQAGSALIAAGLKLGDENEAPSDRAPDGEIIGQYPLAHTKAKRDSSVSVTVSSGRSTEEAEQTFSSRTTESVSDRQQQSEQSEQSSQPQTTPSDSPPTRDQSGRNQRRRRSPWIIVGTAIGVLSLFIVVGIVTYLSNKPTVVFTDDFSDTSGGWPRVEETGGGDELDYANDRYRIINGPPPNLIPALADGAGTIDEAIVEIDATGDAPDENSGWGVVCRAADYHNYYSMGISSIDRTPYIGKVKDNETNVLALGKPSDAVSKGTASNHIRGDCLGNKLTLYVNEQKILEANDAAFASGKVGLFVDNAASDPPGTDVSFDNFLVSKP